MARDLLRKAGVYLGLVDPEPSPRLLPYEDDRLADTAERTFLRSTVDALEARASKAEAAIARVLDECDAIDRRWRQAGIASPGLIDTWRIRRAIQGDA
ncbi:MAG: hypothetical protein ACTHMS_23525 [Jatrophihabitans sp.]|uniref:hypothetical protein n=1 Tax=Jatrophihabitans sp. TaxID=1932789 RepID=UPI003F80F53F